MKKSSIPEKKKSDDDSLQQKQFSIIYKLRKRYPKNTVFYIVKYFVNFMGIILIANGLSDLESENTTIKSLVISLTILKEKQISEKFQTSYLYVVSVSFFLLVVFISVFIFIFFTKKKLTLRLTIKFYSWILTLISLFSQHLIEYFFIGIFNFAKGNSILKISESYFEILLLIICILNVLFVYVCFALFTYTSVNVDYNSEDPKGNKNLLRSAHMYLLLSVPCAQGLYTCFNLFGIDKRFLSFFYLVFIINHFCLSWKYYNFYYKNFALHFRNFLMTYCLISGLVDIILYYSCSSKLSQPTSYIKTAFILVHSCILSYYNHILSQKNCLTNFELNVFNDKKHLSPKDIMYYLQILELYIQKKIDLVKILDCFSHPRSKCKKKNICYCTKVDISNWVNERQFEDPEKSSEKSSSKAEETPLKVEKNNKTKEGTLGETPLKDSEGTRKKGQFLANISTSSPLSVYSFYDFILIAESEIAKAIYFYYKKNQISILETLIYLHIEFVSNFKVQKQYAIYLNYEYTHSSISKKFSYKLKYLFYEQRRLIYKNLEHLNGGKLKRTMVPNEQIKNRTNRQFKYLEKVYETLVKFETIRNSLMDCCNLSNNICVFKNNSKIKSTTGISSYYLHCENLLVLADKLKKAHNKMIELISSLRSKISHYETNYFLIYYFELIFGETPQEIREKLVEKVDDKYLCNNSMAGIEAQANQMIAFLNEQDEFVIKYLSSKIYGPLDYSIKNLQDKPISVLIPNQLVTFHKFLLKKFALFCDSPFKRSTFVLDKNKFLHKFTFIANSFPSIDNNLGIIFNIEFEKEDNQEFLEYNFILDKSFRFIGSTRKFSQEFFFTLEMINTLRLDFCSFFSVGNMKNKIDLKQSKDKKNMLFGNMQKENQIHSVFSLPAKDFFEVEKKLKKFNFSTFSESSSGKECYLTAGRKYAFPIFKKNILKNINTFNKIINELGFDIEWYSKIKCFQDRLNIKNSSSYFYCKMQYFDLDFFSYFTVSLTEKVEVFIHMKSMRNFQEILKRKEEKKLKNTSSLFKQTFESKSTLSGGGKETASNYNNSKPAQPRPSKFYQSINYEHLNNVSQNDDDLPITQKDLSQISRIQSAISLIGKNNSSFLSNSQNSFSNSMNLMNKPSNIKDKYYNNANFSPSTVSNEENSIDASKLFTKKVFIKYLFILDVIFGLAILLLNVFFFVFNEYNLSLFKGLFDINAYSILVKADVYFNVNKIIEYCSKIDQNPEMDLFDTQAKITFSKKEMNDHFTFLTQKLNEYSSNKQINALYQILTKETEFKYIFGSFVLKSRTSCIKEEILLFHYFLGIFQREEMSRRCKIMEIFSTFNRLRNDKDFNETESSDILNLVPNSEEEVTMYVISNTLTNFKSILEYITEETNSLLRSHGKYSIKNTIIYNMIIIGFCIVLAIGNFFIIFDKKNNLKILLVLFFEKGGFGGDIKEEIDRIRKCMDDFSGRNEEKVIRSKTANNSLFTFFKHKIIKHEKRKKHKIDQKADSIKKDLLNLSLFDSSNVGVSTSYMSRNEPSNTFKKKKKPQANKFFIQTNLKNSQTTPKIISISLIATVLLFLLLLLILIIIIVVSSNEFTLFTFSNMLSINFLQRIPRMSEIVLYSIVSMMFNDIYFIRVEQNSYKSLTKFNYYDEDEDIDSNSYFKTLNGSAMGLYYYQFLIDQGNIDTLTEKKKGNSVLKHLVKTENKFSQKNNFCIYSSSNYLERYPLSDKLVPNLAGLSQFSTLCKLIGGDLLTLNSLEMIINTSVKQMIWTYTDFAKDDPDKRDLVKYARSTIYANTLNLISGPMNQVYTSYIEATLEDLNETYNKGLRAGNIFSLVTGFVCIIIFTQILYSNFLLKNKINSMLYIRKLIKRKERMIIRNEYNFNLIQIETDELSASDSQKEI